MAKHRPEAHRERIPSCWGDDPGMGSQRGPRRGMGRVLRSGIPGSEVVWKTETQGCGLPEKLGAGQGRTPIKSRPPRPPPASARRVSTRSPLLGLCNPGTWQPEEGRLGKRREKRGGAPGWGMGSIASGGAPRCPSERFQPSPTPYPCLRLSFPSAFFPSQPPWQGVLALDRFPSRVAVSAPKFSALLPRLSISRSEPQFTSL